MNQASVLVLVDICLVELELWEGKKPPSFSCIIDILFQSSRISLKRKTIFGTAIYQSMALYTLLICMTEF